VATKRNSSKLHTCWRSFLCNEEAAMATNFCPWGKPRERERERERERTWNLFSGPRCVAFVGIARRLNCYGSCCCRRWALQQRRSVSDETRMDKCAAPSFGTFLFCSLRPTPPKWATQFRWEYSTQEESSQFQIISGSRGVFGDVASPHSFKAGGLQLIIHPVLSWPDGYSLATAIVTTSSNRVVGILAGYRHMESRLSTMSFCPVMSYGSPVMFH
jgi:hypothetical protein